MRLMLQPGALCLLLYASAGPAFSADPATQVAVPGSCFITTFPKQSNGRVLDRIELQQVQTTTKDGAAVGPPRVRIGLQPKGRDDLMPSGLSEPCTGDGARLTCELRCEASGKAVSHGRFRIEPMGKDAVKLMILSPITLDACTPGETPVVLPKALAGRSFTLRRGASASDCFH